MKKLLLTGLTLLLVISGATVAFGLAGDDSPSRTVSSTTTSTAEDVSGPCDEAEHANDPRCTGAATDDDRRGNDEGRGRDHPEDDGIGGDDAGEDVSGPCDEAEHANDPRCTGAATDDDGGRVDNSGPGSLNSGPGNAEDGHGHEDHSGPGHGGDDDSSGPGSGDDD